MSVPQLLSLIGFVLAGGLAMPSSALAQIPKRVGSTIQRSIEKKVGDAADKAVKCALGDKACADKAAKDGKPVVVTDAKGEVITDENGEPITDQDEAARRVQQPGEGVWRNYDFVPGKRVLRAVSLESQPVGRFPATDFRFGSGNMQVVELAGKKWLEATSNSVFQLELPDETGPSYSVEFSLKIPTANIGVALHFAPLTQALARNPHDYIHLYSRPGVYRQGRELSATYLPRIVGKEVAVKLQVDSGYAILYLDADRVAQVPTAQFPSTRVLEFRMSANARFPSYLTDVVVASGLDDLYHALTTEGAVTTRGIFFDIDSDRLRPESTRVLTDLVEALRRADSLAVTIEGHTDAQGDDAYNLKLSERRAAAVVKYLTDQGIAANRLRSVGKGETEPVASNDTAEGRKENRRVVIRAAR